MSAIKELNENANLKEQLAEKDAELRLTYERVARLESILQAVIRGEYNNARARESWQEYLAALAKVRP